MRLREPFRRGRCTVCGRDVAVRKDGTARFHRGSEVCRLGGQAVIIERKQKPRAVNPPKEPAA